jgi:hypothetical protein
MEPGVSRPDGPTPEEQEATDAADAPETGGSTAAAPVNRRKVWLFSVAAVVVLVVAGVVVYLLTRDDSTDKAGTGPSVPSIEDSNAPSSQGQPPPPTGTTATLTAPSAPATSAAPAGDPGKVQSVAEQAATAITNADVKTLAQLSCDPSAAGEEDTFPTNAKVEVIGEPEVSGDTATINVRVTVEGAEPAEIPMPLTKQDGRWCIP